MHYGNFGGENSSYLSHDITTTFNAVLGTEKINPSYILDFDNDTVENERDNCPFLENAEQKDINYNGIGDNCEDFDRDGILNSKDNCIENWNYDQKDSDTDGIGDACDKVDDRFTEQNKWLFYVGAVLIVGLFFFMAYKMFFK